MVKTVEQAQTPEHATIFTPEFRRQRNIIERLGHKLRRAQHYHEELEPNEQARITAASVSRLLTPAAAEDFTKFLFGTAEPIVTEEDLEGLPPDARKTLLKALSKRAESGIAWLLLDSDSEAQRWFRNDFSQLADKFLATYHVVARQLGLFPYPAKLENVSLQRIVDFRDRTLAHELLFAQTYHIMQQRDAATAPFLAYLANTLNTYEKHPLDQLQQIVLQKSKLSPERITKMEEDGLWDNVEDVSAMCVDRGVRELLLKMYGLFRGARIERPISGYHEGQLVMVRNANLKRVMRVAHSE